MYAFALSVPPPFHLWPIFTQRQRFWGYQVPPLIVKTRLLSREPAIYVQKWCAESSVATCSAWLAKQHARLALRIPSSASCSAHGLRFSGKVCVPDCSGRGMSTGAGKWGRTAEGPHSDAWETTRAVWQWKPLDGGGPWSTGEEEEFKIILVCSLWGSLWFSSYLLYLFIFSSPLALGSSSSAPSCFHFTQVYKYKFTAWYWDSHLVEFIFVISDISSKGSWPNFNNCQSCLSCTKISTRLVIS